MATYNFTSLSAAAKQIAKDARKRDERVRRAVVKAAKITAETVRRDIAPKAFGELAESIHFGEALNGAYVIADAPHAEAVEVGSRPHTPPLAPIIAWVRLRGIQGLLKNGGLAKHALLSKRDKSLQQINSSTSAMRIARMLREQLGSKKVTSKRAADWRALAKTLGGNSRGSPLVDEATLAVARAIQTKIAKFGTKPQRYMFSGVSVAMEALDRFVKVALEDT